MCINSNVCFMVLQVQSMPFQDPCRYVHGYKIEYQSICSRCVVMYIRKTIVGGMCRIVADFTEHSFQDIHVIVHNIILPNRVRKMAVELFCFLMVRGRSSARMENLHQCISSMETSSIWNQIRLWWVYICYSESYTHIIRRYRAHTTRVAIK